MSVNILNAFSAAKKVEKAIEDGAEHLKEDAKPVIAFATELLDFTKEIAEVLPTASIALEHVFEQAVAAGKLTPEKVAAFNAAFAKAQAFEAKAVALAPHVLKLEQEVAAAAKVVADVVK